MASAALSLSVDSAVEHGRRRERRQRVLFGGKIYLEGGFTLDCSIRNISEHGAQISVGRGQAPPDDFYLIEIRSGMAYRASVAWRRAPLTGVMFNERFDLKTARAGAPVRLRQLWIDCAPR